MTTLWTDRIAMGARDLRSSAIRDLLQLTAQPDMISFAGGLPAAELFPAEELCVAAERAIAEAPLAALQYSPTEGYGPLRELVAGWLESLGLQLPGDQVLS